MVSTCFYCPGSSRSFPTLRLYKGGPKARLEHAGDDLRWCQQGIPSSSLLPRTQLHRYEIFEKQVFLRVLETAHLEVSVKYEGPRTGDKMAEWAKVRMSSMSFISSFLADALIDGRVTSVCKNMTICQK